MNAVTYAMTKRDDLERSVRHLDHLVAALDVEGRDPARLKRHMRAVYQALSEVQVAYDRLSTAMHETATVVEAQAGGDLRDALRDEMIKIYRLDETVDYLCRLFAGRKDARASASGDQA